MSLGTEILKTFEPEIAKLTLAPSDGGKFEVTVNGSLIYSKLQSRCHPEPGEVLRLIRQQFSL